MRATACKCGGIVRDKVCDRCGPRVQKRPKTAARGYDGRWQRKRKRYLAEHPLCVDCEANDMVTPASEVHHVRKIKDRPDLRLEDANLMALCPPCHAIRTGRGE